MPTDWTDAEVWMQVDALAAHFERVNGYRVNRMTIGEKVARTLEPGSTHPPHLDWQSPTPGIWFPARPFPGDNVLMRWARRRDCRKDKGGHFWHPADPMIEWFCCYCGADVDGNPKDGPGWRG